MKTSRFADRNERSSSQWNRRQVLKAGIGAGLFAAAGGGFLLGACGGEDEEEPTTAAAGGTTPQAATTPASGQVKKGGTLVVGWEDDVATLEPTQLFCAHEVRVGHMIMDTPWSLYGDSTEIVPALAESWQASPDGLTWDIKLKPGLKFQDGTTCDAEAVKWSYDRWLDPNHPFHNPPYSLVTYYLGTIQSVEATGELDLRFTLKQLDALFEANMLLSRAGVISPTALQEKGTDAFALSPVGTGAFKVAEWEKGVRIILERNDFYWGDKAIFDRVIIRPIIENAQRLSQLQSGEVDLVVAMAPEFIPTIEASPDFQVIQVPSNHIWWIALNMHEEPMKKKEVRQALNYAVNKEAVVNEILRGAAVITPGVMLPNTWSADPSVRPYPYDPQKAKELLTAAGYPNGFTTKFWVPESGSGMIAPKEIAQIVQANLKEVGVNAEIVTQEWTSYVADWGGRGFDEDGRPFVGMGEMSWNSQTPDPQNWLNPNLRTDAHPPGAFNGSYYSNPTVDDLLTKASGTIDQQERAGYLHEVQRVLNDDCPWIFMFSANVVAAAKKSLKGVGLNPNPSILRLESAYFEE